MTLAEIIAAHIRPFLLERVVYDQGIVPENERVSLFKGATHLDRALAERTVRAYGAQAPTLAFGLYEQLFDSDWRTASLLSEHFDKRGYFNLQASLTGRVPTLPLERLSEFFYSVRRHVCLILARKGENAAVSKGTGFLVGPDLVLTCRHVLEPFTPDDKIDQQKNRIDIYFDFLHGDPVEGFNVRLPRARRVGVEQSWHIVSCKSVRPDGIEDHLLTPAQRQVVETSLDFVLLRLNEQIGRQPVARGGGARRGWISLPDDAVVENLQENDWIVIPQHPGGFPLRVGLGRFKTPDATGTRLRYDAGASGGSSGAPCFNQNFELLGIHNAFVGPEAAPLLNQAIRFDRIACSVRQPIDEALKNGSPSGDQGVIRWSIARPGEAPNVIIGREVLLTWLRAAASTALNGLRDRVYVAHATASGAGCSFSSDVLHAEIRDTRQPRAVYGRRGQQLPATAEDFLISLLRELGIDLADVEKMPVRPGPGTDPGLPVLDGEVDKLERWLSMELPTWLGRVIETHLARTIDMRQLARDTARLYKDRGAPVPEEIAIQAASNTPIMVRQNVWDYAFVVLDELRAPGYQGPPGPLTELKGEVRSLIAALVQGKPESAMPGGLRRLRWMFLGELPDFLAEWSATADGATVERLDPAAAGFDDVLAVWDRMAQAYMPLADSSTVFMRGVARFVVDQTARANPSSAERLAALQQLASDLAAGLLKEVEQ